MDGGGSILGSIGTEIIGVMSPVSICMLLVVLLVSTLTAPSSGPPTAQIRTAANLVYLESPTDTTFQKFEGALLNAAVFVLLITLVTFVLVLLYYYHCTNFLKHYTRFSAFFVLATMGGAIFLSLIEHFSIPIDSFTCFFLLFNFSVTGVVSVFSRGFPIIVKQFYMIALGIIVAAWFAQLPEWTTWVLLVALALYDLVAVLAPGGPLKILVELASSRDEELPALVYEARPNVVAGSGSANRLGNLGLLVAGILQVDSNGGSSNSNNGDNDRVIELQNVTRNGHEDQNEDRQEEYVVNVGGNENEIEVDDGHQEETSPLMAGNPRERRGGVNGNNGGAEREDNRAADGVMLLEMMNEGRRTGRGRDGDHDDDDDEMIPGLKLGLGDFIFYSVLVGRAAMYDLMTVYACYLAIISGLGCTLILLAVYRHALPALPISIALGIIFYFLTRLLMEPFVVGTATNLMMF